MYELRVMYIILVRARVRVGRHLAGGHRVVVSGMANARQNANSCSDGQDRVASLPGHHPSRCMFGSSVRYDLRP